MSGLAFPIEIRQSDLDALRERLGSAGPRYPFCTIGVRRYWLSGTTMRNQGPLAPAPGAWLRVTAIEETAQHYFVVLGAAQAHVLPKRALDQTVQHSLRRLTTEVPALASDWGGPPGLEIRRPSLVRGGLSRVRDAVLGLLGGIRLALTLTSSRAFRDLEPGPMMLLGFAGMVVAALAGVDFFLVPFPREFNLWSFPLDATWLLLAVVVCYIPVRALTDRPGALEGVLTRLAAGAVVPLVVGKLYVDLDFPTRLGTVIQGSDSAAQWLVYGWMAWLGLIALRVIRLVVPLRGARNVALGAYLFGAIATVIDLVPTLPAWVSYAADAGAASDEAASENAPEYYRLDVEGTYYAQPHLLSRALSGLAPERPGVEDLYFVGFAGDARQDVFMREVQNFQRFLDISHDTRNRSVLLINHLDVVGEVPLANRHNLALTLRRVGQVMNSDEDTLFLYMTSHGSSDGRFVVHFQPLRLTDLRPGEVGSMLEASRIRWQVVAVSACFSGAFVEPLKRATALIMTAARADRSSFGCENGRDYTYFGEALRSGLERTPMFTDAFEFARQRVTARERAEGKDPSYPQISVGAEIARRLERAPALD